MYKLILKNSDLKISIKKMSLINIEKVYFSNYGYNKNTLKGEIFNKKFKILVSDNYNKIDFKSWVKKVDKRVYKKLKLHLSDLPDEDFWVNWNDGMKYKSMADIIVKDQYDLLDFILNKLL